MSFLADLVDNLGTSLNLPDFGYSEALNGNKASVNTGRVGYTDTGGLINTGSSPSASLVNNAYAAQQTPAQGTGAQQAAGGGTSASTTYDPYTAAAAAAASQNAAYNAQAQGYQDAYNALDPQLNTGLSNLQNGYNSNLNTLNDNNAVAQRNYDTSVGQNTQNFLSTKNNINTTTRNNANSLQRLLGLNGAGNSSAATEAAPYAAALQGSQNLNGAQQTYATNQANLDTSYGDTQRAYKQKLDDLAQNLYAGKQNLQGSIAQNKINLLNQISTAKTQAGDTSGNGTRAQQVKDLLSSLTGYGNQYATPVAVNTDLNYTAPTATDYSLGQAANASNGLSGASSDISPAFLSLLTGQKRDANGNLITA